MENLIDIYTENKDKTNIAKTQAEIETLMSEFSSAMSNVQRHLRGGNQIVETQVKTSALTTADTPSEPTGRSSVIQSAEKTRVSQSRDEISHSTRLNALARPFEHSSGFQAGCDHDVGQDQASEIEI